ncbi:hypothetical protein GCM10010172_09140 [Paractinoplanes ferrugineus]|uniref:Uncharacterized protein n=1 Tax=Paractinoplanes ferrugineus TaxID=113564 RepID=A0A919IWI9_9ACTN|nr:hypothetical protein Afe05nite_13190 [Actinoplanes ferrugineus]
MVIATVFLTIIGMTAGFVLGERHRDRLRAADPQDTTDIVTPYPADSSYASGPSGALCPDETIAFAAANGYPADLRQIFKAVTNNDTNVWICEDSNGQLYYQSQTKASSGVFDQTANALFLPRANRQGDNEYSAVASDGAKFLINSKQLRITFPDGRKPQVNSVESWE